MVKSCESVLLIGTIVESNAAPVPILLLSGGAEVPLAAEVALVSPAVAF